MSEDWTAYLNDEERAALQEIEDWINKPSDLLGKTVRLMGKPMELAYRLVPARVKDALGNAVYGVLSSIRQTSKATVSRQGLLDKISARLGQDVGTHPEQIYAADIRKLDPVAMESLNFNRRTAMVEGGAAGAVGLPGLIADVPALYLLVFRVIQEIAVCYGFNVEDPGEQTFMLKVLDVGHYLEDDNKRRGMEELATLEDMISSDAPLKDLERVALAKGLQSLARQLSVALAHRKLAQAVVVIGGVVGASVNYALVSDVGTTAYYAYRRRFLHEVALRRMKRRAAFAPPAPEEAQLDEPPHPEPRL